MVGARDRCRSAQAVQPRGDRRFGGGARASRGHLPGALPQHGDAGGRGIAPRQEYFFTSASLQDILRRHLAQYETLASLPDKAAIQLNDTHPAIAVAELMRILVDEHNFPWPDAWSITTRTLNYTKHTLMPRRSKLADVIAEQAFAAPSADHLSDQLV